MKIEMDYDPVKPEITVRIDGQETDKSDIYGFLYPVRNCLLQTWLLPTGSWNGLAWQLRELGRGERVELVFAGRSEDFEDVENALRGMEEVRLVHAGRDPFGAYETLFGRLEKSVRKLLDEEDGKDRKETIDSLFPDAAERIRAVRSGRGGTWLYTISDEDGFYQADQAKLCCCMVREEYLDSYEKLDHLNDLTRSMRRSQGMICCCIGEEEKRADWSRYAGDIGLGFRFDTEEHCYPLFERKYGNAYGLRLCLEGYQRIRDILAECYAQREALWKRKAELKEQERALQEQKERLEEQERELNQAEEAGFWEPEEQELDRCRSELKRCRLELKRCQSEPDRYSAMLNWLDKKKPVFLELSGLLENGILQDEQRKE